LLPRANSIQTLVCCSFLNPCFQPLYLKVYIWYKAIYSKNIPHNWNKIKPIKIRFIFMLLHEIMLRFFTNRSVNSVLKIVLRFLKSYSEFDSPQTSILSQSYNTKIHVTLTSNQSSFCNTLVNVVENYWNELQPRVANPGLNTFFLFIPYYILLIDQKSPLTNHSSLYNRLFSLFIKSILHHNSTCTVSIFTWFLFFFLILSWL